MNITRPNSFYDMTVKSWVLMVDIAWKSFSICFDVVWCWNYCTFHIALFATVYGISIYIDTRQIPYFKHNFKILSNSELIKTLGIVYVNRFKFTTFFQSIKGGFHNYEC